MADAGKIAPTYDGEWSADKTYDFHTYVTHNNNCYIAKQPSTGIEPTEEENAYWFLALKNVNANDIDNILNGTTTVGNANNADTVDGYHANQLRNTNPEGVPESSYLISQYVNNTNVFHIKSIDGIPTRVDKAIDSEQLGGKGASEYVQKTGDSTIDGNVEVKSASLVERKLAVENSVRRMTLELGTDGSGYLWDGTNKKAIITSSKDGTNTFNGTASGNLPLTGGTVGNGSTDIPLRVYGDTDKAMVAYSVNGASKGGLGFDANGKPIVWCEGVGVLDILHTGNKPSGTYTGNGSATERYIAIPCTQSELLLVTSTNGMALVGRYCTILCDASVSRLGWESAMFYSGLANLKLTTNHALLNATGVTYTYWVL